MKKYLLKLSTFGAILILLDWSFSYILIYNRPIDYAFLIQSKKDFFKSTEEFEILCIGDSHIADAIDPRSTSRILNKNVYNLGIHGASSFENYYVTKSALAHQTKKPEIAFLGTSPIMFDRKKIRGRYTPLIIDFDWEFISNSEEGLDSKFFFRSLREKYLLKPLVKKVLGFPYHPTRDIKSVYNGHLEFYNQTPQTNWDDFSSEHESKINLAQVEYFRKTIDLLLANDIKVVIVHSPIWEKELNEIMFSESFQSFDLTINQIIQDYNLDVFGEDYLKVSCNYNFEEYLDTQHLNYYGAYKFTHELCDYLKSRENLVVDLSML